MRSSESWLPKRQSRAILVDSHAAEILRLQLIHHSGVMLLIMPPCRQCLSPTTPQVPPTPVRRQRRTPDAVAVPTPDRRLNPSGVSARALSTILDRSLSGLPASEIAQVTPDIVERIFRQNISMGKGLGLMSMVQAVRSLAQAAAAA